MPISCSGASTRKTEVAEQVVQMMFAVFDRNLFHKEVGVD
jgi:hypothetical protein